MQSKIKFVYMFSEGNAHMSHLLGRKGANLSEMLSLQLPVPQGFTISTQACQLFYHEKKTIPSIINEQIENSLKELELLTDKRFGDPQRPLLVSVRSGPQVSMPGMMDTILNLGLNQQTVAGLIQLTQNPHFIYASLS